jgi:NAD(P)-dependent dehydrogenase (short-subunit alcohol dehydrogenase family)
VVIIPDITYPSGPIETTSPAVWSDLLNARVLGTIATTQAFLRTICEFKARVLMLTPAVIPALSPPFHAPESTIVAALAAFTYSLAGELATMGIPVAHFKLGAFDCGNVGGRHYLQQSPSRATRADVLAWSATARAAYARNFVAQAQRAGNRGCLFGSSSMGGPRGTSLRELHNAVFDALTVKKPQRVWRVGSGSLVYDIVGRWVPAGVVGWMLGIRRVNGGGEDAVLGEDGLNDAEITTQSVDWEKV